MENLTSKQIVREDAEAIYIGNIYTVEENLVLPTTGRNGSAITWATDMPHIIAENGKVVRPREGAGNRHVVLTATVTHGDELLTREFGATVLALKSNVKIVRALDINLDIEKGIPFEMPSVAIAEKDDGTFSTIEVVWHNVADFTNAQEGTYEIDGESLNLDDVVYVKAYITVKSEVTPPEDMPTTQANKVGYGEAKITGGFLNENRKRAEEFLISCDLDSMLYNFREAAGLDLKGAEPMLGWDAPECLLKGHTTGHYLSGIALAYAGNTENREKFGEITAYMIDGLAQCQDAMQLSGKFNDGFLSGYSEEQFDKLQEYVVYPKIWAPYYTLHKILAGLIDCYEYASSEKALDIASKLGLWIYSRLSALPKQQLQKMWAMYIAGEFGGINESLAKLAKFTKKPEHINAAKLFNNEKLFFPMSQNVDTLGGIHGNQHVPQVVGALEIYARTGEKEYYDIARNFWHYVTTAHIYNIGGSGEGEMFQDPHKIGTRLTEKTAESCVSYNMLKLTSMLFEYEPKAEFMDYFEKTLLNHIAASQDQSGPIGGSTYFMPLLPGGKKGYDSTSNTCCHGTGLENHVKYQDAIYYMAGKSVYVNQYVPSELCVDSAGGLAIVGDYLKGSHKAVIKITREGFDELRLRIPCWSKDGFGVKHNGNSVSYDIADGYAVIKGDLKVGDELEVSFDFKLRVVRTEDAPDIVSLYYGPLVMVALDDSDEFIALEYGFESTMQKTGDFEFVLDGRKFVPNYFASTQKYHAYFKIM